MALEHYEKYFELASLRRGEIINRSIGLEREIDKQIANYFCGSEEQRDEMLIVLLSTNKLTFESKLQTLKFIIEKNGEGFKKQNPKYLQDLEAIMQHRNKLAHSELALGNVYNKVESLRSTFLSTKKNKIETIEYTPELMAAIIESINKYTTILMVWHPIS